MRAAPALVVHHARSGVAALNVVSAALDADARTAGTEVVFAKDAAEVARAIGEVAARGAAPVVFWSFYSTDFPRAAEALAAVRAATGSAALHVAGGVHASAEPRATLAAGFDLVVIGEGEATAVELFVALAEGRDPRALDGTAHLDGARLVSHGPGPRRPLDDFPGFNLRQGKWNPLEITRGCVYACSFCQTPYMFKARFRHRSIDNVRAHMRAMVADGATYARFVTPTALSYGAVGEEPDLAAVEALLAAVREEVGPTGRIYFGTFPSEVRPEHVTEASLAVLARWVDNDTLVIGGQSGSERVLARTRRGHGVAEVVRAVELSVRYGFKPDVDFLFGLPDEDAEDRTATAALAERLVAMGARIHAHAFLPLPGTPLRDATPTAIEGDVARVLQRLEARGASHGQWRRQLVDAADLVRRRRAAS